MMAWEGKEEIYKMGETYAMRMDGWMDGFIGVGL